MFCFKIASLSLKNYLFIFNTSIIISPKDSAIPIAGTIEAIPEANYPNAPT